jgi:molybdenum cofactor synthesis domain-containing protein
MGKAHIFAWEPGKDEVHEEDAARELAQAVSGENITFSGPSEGKFLLSSEADGLFCVNSRVLIEINSVPDYTVACRRGNSKVLKGENLAGIRIVPLVTLRQNVDAAVKIANESPFVFSVLPFRALKAGIIITGGEIFHGRIADRFEPVLRRKLSEYDAEILGVTICDDDTSMITGAIRSFAKQGAELILLTGGMSVDPDDVTPTAIRESGAQVVSYGVPMQPGNMLTIAYLGATVLVGVPGASLHSPVTSLDVFLPRIFAGVEIHKSDIDSMGEGGLL